MRDRKERGEAVSAWQFLKKAITNKDKVENSMPKKVEKTVWA
jgi:hypothetical protein